MATYKTIFLYINSYPLTFISIQISQKFNILHHCTVLDPAFKHKRTQIYASYQHCQPCLCPTKILKSCALGPLPSQNSKFDFSTILLLSHMHNQNFRLLSWEKSFLCIFDTSSCFICYLFSKQNMTITGIVWKEVFLSHSQKKKHD